MADKKKSRLSDNVDKINFAIFILVIIQFIFSSTTFSQSQSKTEINNIQNKTKKYCILYVFPHPDDESYGPAAAIDKSIKEGHEVHLLTLTKGGATKNRFRLNLTVEEMGKVRTKEMLNVEKTLNLSSMSVLDFPDGGLKKLDPREIEKVIYDHVQKIKPDIIVTYPVHGISGHNDHLVCHAAVKRVFMDVKGENSNLRRLVFWHLTEEDNQKNQSSEYKTIEEDETDCIIKLSPENVEAAHKVLDCYVTYKPTIVSSNIKKMVTESSYYDFFQESFSPPVTSLTANLPSE